jgi:hypothetical protein
MSFPCAGAPEFAQELVEIQQHNGPLFPDFFLMQNHVSQVCD